MHLEIATPDWLNISESEFYQLQVKNFFKEMEFCVGLIVYDGSPLQNCKYEFLIAIGTNKHPEPNHSENVMGMSVAHMHTHARTCANIFQTIYHCLMYSPKL